MKRKSPRSTPVASKPLDQINWKFRAALAALVLIAWSNTFGLGFALDGGVVASDVRIQAATSENVNLILGKHYWWPNPADRLYRPVTTLTYLLNHSFTGEGAAGYHAVNILLHIINVWLVLALAFQLFRAREPAFCAAALWAVHPITTESVTNIAGRADLLAAMAILSGLLLYIRARSWPGAERWLAAVALFAIATVGVFSKENAVILLALMVLWDQAFPIDSRIVRRVPLYAAVAASVVLMLLARARVFQDEVWPARAFVDNPLIGAGFWQARFTAIKAVAMELWLMVFPLRLSSDRSFAQIPISDARDLWVWISLAIIVALLALAVFLYRKNDRVLFWSIAFVAVTLLPTSNLIVLIGATIGERFLYLPSIGVAIAIAALVFRLQNRRIVAGVLAVIVVLFMLRTWLRNRDWDSDLTLTTADEQVSPRSFRLHSLRARTLFAASAERNVDEAIREGEAAWAILRPLPPADGDQYTLARLGVCYRKKGDLAGADPSARAWYQKSVDVLLSAREISRAIEKDFDQSQLAHGRPLPFRYADDSIYFNLAGAYSELGQWNQALDALHEELTLTPLSPDVYETIARVNIKRGDFASAAIALDERALVLGPTAEALDALQDVYSHLPEGYCAFARSGDDIVLNPACPGVLQLRCRALSDLKQVFSAARNPEPASHFAALASQQSCPQ